LSLYDNANLPEKAKKEYVFIKIENSHNYFKDNYYSYLKKFWKNLRETPEIIYEILKYSSPDQLTSSFNNFIINDLFCDIFHPDNISNTLYFVIEKLLESEISKMKIISDFNKVLNDSNIGYLLEGLLLRKDIQNYFSIILTDIIEAYENSEESSKPLLFKISDIQDYLILEKEMYENELRRTSTANERKEIMKRKKKENYLFNQLYKMTFPKNTDSKIFCSALTLSKKEKIIMKNKKEMELFVTKYLIDINKTDLNDLINKEKSPCIIRYLKYNMKLLDKDSNIFSNQTLLEKIQKSENSEKLLFYYKKNFLSAINILQKILNKFHETINVIPTPIIYISRIISDLLINKFKTADMNDIYKQLGSFVFMKLFKYFFLSLDYYPLINNVLLSESTKKNLFKIFEIFSQLISGELFKSENESFYYTPFNWFLIDNINIFYEVCQKLTFKNILNSKEKKIYDIDKNNEFFSHTVCFNMKIFETFMDIIDKNKKNIFENNKNKKFKEIVDFLNNNFDKNKSIDTKNVVNYFLYFDILFKEDIMQKNFSKKFSKLKYDDIRPNININNNSIPIKKSKDKIKERDKIETPELIEAKRILIEILLNIDDTDIKEINQKIKLNSLKEVLKTIKNFYSEKCLSKKNDILNIPKKQQTPIEWYINSLLFYLDKLEEYYSKNDYTNLFISLSKDINNSIKNFDFKLLAKIVEKLKYAKYFIKYYKNFQKKYIELIINTKTKNFIEREKINIILNYKDKILDINIVPDKNDFQKSPDLCQNINEFILKFPNLSEIAKNQDTELFIDEENMNLKGILDNYFNILKKKLHKYFIETETDIAFKKIKKYILSKIYEKIYPRDYDNDDLLFYYKSISLSWIEPKHLKIPMSININNLILVTNNFFKQIDNEKTPSCKMDVIGKIFNTINSALQFSLGGNFSTDDIAPIFEYALIKARPERLSSNLKYLEFFLEKGSELSDMYFDFMKNNLDSIKEINYTKFSGITKEEFLQNCYEANKYYVA